VISIHADGRNRFNGLSSPSHAFEKTIETVADPRVAINTGLKPGAI
jgi:hypothetical protein